MNRDDIIRMARDAGIPEMAIEGVFIANSDDLGRLIAAEREACAKVCDEQDHNGVMIAKDCAAAIRARGQ